MSSSRVRVVHLTQNNANFFWDDSNARLGIGTTAPSTQLNIVANGSSAQAHIDTYGNSNATVLSLRRAKGSFTTPTAVISADLLGRLSFRGYDGSAFSNNRVSIDGSAAEAWTTGANGTYLSFLTTSLGTTTTSERMRIDATGNVGIGTTAPGYSLEVLRDGSTANLGLTNYGSVTPAINGRRARGSVASPLALAVDNGILSLNGGGYDGTSFTDIGARILFSAAEAWTVSTHGTYMRFDTTPIGSTTVAERMRIDAAGNVGIGTVTPTSFKLEVAGNVGPEADNTRDLGSASRRWANIYATNFVGAITPTGFTPGSVVFAGPGRSLSQDNPNFFWDDTNNRLGIGTTAPAGILDLTGSAGVTQNLTRSSADTSAANIRFRKDRVAAIVQNGDELGYLDFSGYDGGTYRRGAYIASFVDGVPGASDMPGNLAFATTPDGAVASIERMRITNAGNVGIGHHRACGTS